MNNKDKILWITSTAIFIALLVVVQVATSFLGNTLITGSIVNMILIISVMTRGPASGAAVAVVSPLAARFFGIGPLWGIIPFQIAGNITLVLLWHIIGTREIAGRRLVSHTVAGLAAAIAKFLVLYISIVRIAVPFLLGLPPAQADAVSKLFSVAQLFTALIGGALAILVLPRLTRAIGPASKKD